jgi:hypothetical protein
LEEFAVEHFVSDKMRTSFLDSLPKALLRAPQVPAQSLELYDFVAESLEQLLGALLDLCPSRWILLQSLPAVDSLAAEVN